MIRLILKRFLTIFKLPENHSKRVNVNTLILEKARLSVIIGIPFVFCALILTVPNLRCAPSAEKVILVKELTEFLQFVHSIVADEYLHVGQIYENVA